LTRRNKSFSPEFKDEAVKMENEFLRKAAAYFARDHR